MTQKQKRDRNGSFFCIMYRSCHRYTVSISKTLCVNQCVEDESLTLYYKCSYSKRLFAKHES